MGQKNKFRSASLENLIQLFHRFRAEKLRSAVDEDRAAIIGENIKANGFMTVTPVYTLPDLI